MAGNLDETDGDGVRYFINRFTNNFVQCVMRPSGLGDFGSVSPVGDAAGLNKQIMEGITFSFVEAVRNVY